MKYCRRCDQHKALEDFHVRRASSDGRQAYCKPCQMKLVYANNSRPEVRAAMRGYCASRRARKTGADAERFTREQLLEHYRGISVGIDGRIVCIYCMGPYEHDDHVVPLKRGGRHARANLVPACARCNLSKHATPLDTWAPWITGYLAVLGIETEEWQHDALRAVAHV